MVGLGFSVLFDSYNCVLLEFEHGETGRGRDVRNSGLEDFGRGVESGFPGHGSSILISNTSFFYFFFKLILEPLFTFSSFSSLSLGRPL